jgi:hypothetical protein
LLKNHLNGRVRKPQECSSWAVLDCGKGKVFLECLGFTIRDKWMDVVDEEGMERVSNM